MEDGGLGTWHETRGQHQLLRAPLLLKHSSCSTSVGAHATQILYLMSERTTSQDVPVTSDKVAFCWLFTHPHNSTQHNTTQIKQLKYNATQGCHPFETKRPQMFWSHTIREEIKSVFQLHASRVRSWVLFRIWPENKNGFLGSHFAWSFVTTEAAF